MKYLETGRIRAAYIDEGSGPPVILAHCSSASHRMWRTLIDRLKPRHRVLAPDLIGYGATERWPEGEPFDFNADAQILIELARLAEEPVHFAGHSYGAAMILQASRALDLRPRGMTLIEPVAFPVLPGAGRMAEWEKVRALAESIEQAMVRNDRRKAAALYMGFWIGPLRWWLAPAKVKERVLETVDKVALEFGAVRTAPQPDFEEARRLRVPALLAYGTKTRKEAIAVIETLAGLLPEARIETVRGAGHMSPLTHPEQVNAMIEEHIAECLGRARMSGEMQAAGA